MKRLRAMLQCKVNFLDDTHFVWELERNAVGQDLFNKVCEHLNLLERDYFGLVMWVSPSARVWLDCSKEIRKQIKSTATEFFFNIKFYPPDPTILAEDITRYFLCLQLRNDILIGRLPCPSDILALLGSYTVQSTLGDYDPNLHKNNYVSKIVLAPNQTEELEKRVMELHSTYRFMSGTQADILFLENIMGLPMYGVDLHPAKLKSAGETLSLKKEIRRLESRFKMEHSIKLLQPAAHATYSGTTPQTVTTGRPGKCGRFKRTTLNVVCSRQKDASDADVMLGVSSEGLMVYEDEIKKNTFLWPRVLKISHKRNIFLLKIRPSEEDESEGDISFSLPNYRACKQLWKCAVEHHSFFRNRLQDTVAKRLLTLGSRFRYHGRTQSECLDASGNITRAPPRFTRYIIKRQENEELLEMLKQPVRSDLDDWFLVYGPDKWHISTLDDVMLESQKLQEWKHHTDDWCVLLDGSPFAIAGVQQVIPTEDMTVMEEKLTDELGIKQSYKVQVVKKGSEIIEKEFPDFELKQEMMRPLMETLKEEVSGEQTQRVVITKQWTETQEDGEKRIERVEMVERRVMVTKEQKISSEDIFEKLEVMQQRLEEVEAIERKLVEVEELRVGLQEVESLEKRLLEVEKEGIELERKDDWYIFLDRKPLMLSATPTESSKIAQEELQQIAYIPKPMKKDDDWYIIFDLLPQTMEISNIVSDVSSPVPEQDQAKEEKRVVETKIPQESVPPEKPKTPTREEVIQFRVRTEETQKQQPEQVAVDYGRSQTIVLEQRAAEPLINEEDDWFVILDNSPRRSVPPVRSISVDLYEEESTEQKKQQVMVEERTRRPQLDAKDDWFLFFDVFAKESVHVPAVDVYEESREEVIQRREVRKEEQVIEMVTVSTKEQITVPERKRTSIIQTPQFPVEPRVIDDDWFLIFDKRPYELKRLSSAADVYEDPREEVIRSRFRTEEVQKGQIQQMIVEDRRPQPVLLEERTTLPQRDMRDDWFTAFDASPKESVRLPAVDVYEESREEVIQRREVRKEEQVIEMVTVSTKEQITVPERKRTSIIQTPQFPVEPRVIDDDWFLIFDKSPYELKRLPSEIRTRDFEVSEAKDQRVQRVVVEPITEKRPITEEKRVSIDELRRTADVLQITPIRVQEVEDKWFYLMDQTPSEKRSIPSVSVATEERRMKEQEDKVRQQQMRAKEEEEEERRRKEQEKRKQELEARRAPASVTVPIKAQAYVEKDDDWFILFDTSPKEKVVAVDTKVPVVDRRAEEEKRRWRREEEEEKRRWRREEEEEKRRWRREEEEEKRRRRREEEEERRERRRQIKIEERPKRPATPEERPVQLQTEVEDDWFTLMGISLKDYIPAAPRTPVISPVAPPKPRPQIQSDQPLTSTPTAQTVSITQKRTKDILDITAESESESESILIRRSQTWAKRIEGESIFVRHSNLMLEDLDVSQEIILKHHASITELKRVFMEIKEDFGPTEWDRRLSSYSPSAKAQLPHANGEILTRMGLIEDDGKTVLHRTQEIIYV